MTDEKRPVGRPPKAYDCRRCGETDGTLFNAGYKSLCGQCRADMAREAREAVTGRPSQGRRPIPPPPLVRLAMGKPKKAKKARPAPAPRPAPAARPALPSWPFGSCAPSPIRGAED